MKVLEWMRLASLAAIIWVNGTTLGFSQTVEPEEIDPSCLDALDEIVATIKCTVPRVSFCDDFAEGVTIAFDSLTAARDTL